MQSRNVCAEIGVSRHVTGSRFAKNRLVKDLPLPLFEECEVFSTYCSIVAAFNLIIFLNGDFLIAAWYLKAAMYLLLKDLDVSNTNCGIHSLEVFKSEGKDWMGLLWWSTFISQMHPLGFCVFGLFF